VRLAQEIERCRNLIRDLVISVPFTAQKLLALTDELKAGQVNIYEITSRVERGDSETRKQEEIRRMIALRARAASRSTRSAQATRRKMGPAARANLKAHIDRRQSRISKHLGDIQLSETYVKSLVDELRVIADAYERGQKYSQAKVRSLTGCSPEKLRALSMPIDLASWRTE
jgi:hypothetical protein